MKCRNCGEKASVNMRQHKLALCKEHYLEWVPEQTERFIKKYEMFSHGDKILVAVSGGKDSLSLWDILIMAPSFNQILCRRIQGTRYGNRIAVLDI